VFPGRYDALTRCYRPAMRLGSDTGGTFTDLVDDEGRIAKVPSTPGDPGRAVREGIEVFGRDVAPSLLAHGTTVATNLLLERAGADVALVTNAGFADVIEIARQDRPSLYDNFADRPAPLVARDRRFEVSGRLDASGHELEPLDLAALRLALGDLRPEVVAVCLLHADLDPSHEQAVAAALRGLGLDVTCSHEVSPVYREYERTVTTAANAYLRPRCRSYLASLHDVAGEVQVLTSAGGLVPVAVAAETPVALALSGPAGGVRAAIEAALANGASDLVTFDMGGTSTDVCLIVDGVPEPAAQRTVAGLPLRLPALDVLTIGAGGGSLAWLDDGDALRVGPRSAGAEPGPACYRRGGTRPTVTDADLAAGRIPADVEFPGIGRLDIEAARAALARAGVTAEGVIQVVDAAMEQALRAVTVARGVDPRGCVLVAFGGAGPLHACAVADALGMPRVIVPARAGVLSAVGVLGSPLQRDLARSWPTPLDHHGLDAAVRSLARAAAGLVGDPDEVVTALDCRYAGQSHELTVARLEEFHDAHARRNGYGRPESPVEVITLRATARRAPAVAIHELPTPRRVGGDGPTYLAEADCTIWVPAGWRARPGAAGALVLERRS
jgi:N-methylhydantoinase A/oxoprolinase/acetone carboxylase beta subunit